MSGKGNPGQSAPARRPGRMSLSFDMFIGRRTFSVEEFFPNLLQRRALVYLRGRFVRIGIVFGGVASVLFGVGFDPAIYAFKFIFYDWTIVLSGMLRVGAVGGFLLV